MMMSESQQRRPFTILLVDDREENLISLEAMLEQPDRKFLSATSGNDALKLALKHDDIGLIMLDVQMPDMDGYEVAQILQSNPKTKHISIVFVTAINKETQYVLKGYEEGAIDYLQKPLDLEVTRAKVAVFQTLYFYQSRLRDTAKQLEQINKQLERFVFIVAHDLKSPLSGIITLLSVLETEPAITNSEFAKEYVNLLSGAANHLSQMITSILEYSRKSVDEQGEDDVDAHTLVQQIAGLLFPPSHITIDIAGQLPVLHTKKLKLQQVFQNLISNAVKYSDKSQGHITIGVNDRGGDFWEFYVQDNGPGVADADQARIFKLFETTENKSNADSSTGLGLNLLKVLVEEQGGRIWVESRPGEGSVFFFEWRKG
jgi:signal transduction histidine kinase